MSKRERDRQDEHLERLWYLKEEGEDALASLRAALGEEFGAQILQRLTAEGLIRTWEDGARVGLTPAGEARARQIVRGHRLGERLIYDAFGDDFEPGACELEHAVTPQLVDSICILLGHPRECPHGLPIPRGSCCERADRVVASPVVPLSELEVGQSGRVVAVRCKNDHLLHKIDAHMIRPGTVLTVHQKRPSFVVEAESATIAMSREIAEGISVWSLHDAEGAAREPGESHRPPPREPHRWWKNKLGIR